jgi:hypothetical protein
MRAGIYRRTAVATITFSGSSPQFVPKRPAERRNAIALPSRVGGPLLARMKARALLLMLRYPWKILADGIKPEIPISDKTPPTVDAK